ncbi:MAG: helix-turn-helix domain-containing protein [Eubacteriales bacterium]
MELKIGTVIKRLRTEKGITQDELANYIGISFQAISKWENDVNTPDISLLPKLAVFFGVTIDDLFSIDDTDHFERIDKMLQDEYIISDDNFIYAERYLKGILAENPNNSEALKRLARLHQHRSNRDLLAMGRYAEQGLSISPFDKDLHGLLVQTRTWRQEPDRLIDFYETFVGNYPSCSFVIEILINAYIKNRYFDKARKLISQAGSLTIYKLFEGDIELQMGNQKAAKKLWDEVACLNPSDGAILFQVAERYKQIEEYDIAVKYYEMCHDAFPSPKPQDSLYSRAFLFEKLGLINEAIDMWVKIIESLDEDYAIKDGEAVDWPKREIQRLTSKLSI